MQGSIQAFAAPQRGWTVIGGLIGLMLVGFVGFLGLRIIPMYLDYFTIQSTLESLKSQPDAAKMSTFDIQKSIQTRFDVGYVDVVKAKDAKIRPNRNGKVVELVYEDRRPLISNLEIVGKFSKSVELLK
jgi:hypothetical protein